MKIENHWLTEARHCQSPNYDDRPDEEDISLIVIHCISLPPNEFGAQYIDDLFCNALNPLAHPYFADIYRLKVSAHLLIRRTGECVQYVAFNKRAWHAGQSVYQKRQRCNDFSIGIELEGFETTLYTQEQYDTLNLVIERLLLSYPQLAKTRIVGHSDIAPQRKTDPGVSFDWSKLN